MAACAFEKLHLFICYSVQWVIGSPQENLACPQKTALLLKSRFCLTGNVRRKVVDADDTAFSFVLCSFWISNDKDLDVFFWGEGQLESDVSRLWNEKEENKKMNEFELRTSHIWKSCDVFTDIAITNRKQVEWVGGNVDFGAAFSVYQS